MTNLSLSISRDELVSIAAAITTVKIALVGTTAGLLAKLPSHIDTIFEKNKKALEDLGKIGWVKGVLDEGGGEGASPPPRTSVRMRAIKKGLTKILELLPD